MDPLAADAIIERQRLKRSLNFWRVAAVLALVLAMLAAFGHRIPQGSLAFGPRGFGGSGFGHYVARYRITGLITDDGKQLAELDQLRRDPQVSAVLLHLDTPGGAVTGGEALHDAVANLATAKPVVAVMDGVAASAGYMIAVATPHIVAHASTLTGSIGVIMETTNVGGLLGKIGVSLDELVSGPLKGQPNPTQPLTPEARVYLQALVMDLYDQFVGLVATGRHMDPARVRTLADGRAYTGRQALPLGLIDELGGEDEARAWLAHARAVPVNLPVREFDRPWSFRAYMTQSLSDIVLSVSQGIRVDGAWAVWQPSAQD